VVGAHPPCTDWTVRDVVSHVVSLNLVFVALLRDRPLPERGVDNLGDDPLAAYRDSNPRAPSCLVQLAWITPAVAFRRGWCGSGIEGHPQRLR
jgi:hypothetical protein